MSFEPIESLPQNVDVEVCVDCFSDEAVRVSVANALAGGAARVELCRDLASGGLTPAMRQVELAREVFGDQSGVLVMVRPRAGGFEYDVDEVDLMFDETVAAEAAGADGVVVGLLTGNRIAVELTRRLVDLAHGLGMSVTFHRAFDAARDSARALEELIDLEVDRVLTSGTPWESGRSAADGIEALASLCVRASGRIEVVVGGGVTRRNVAPLVRRLYGRGTRISMHAYSDLLVDGLTDTPLVADLVQTIEQNVRKEGAGT